MSAGKSSSEIPQGLFRLVELEAKKKHLRDESSKIERQIKKERLREEGSSWYATQGLHTIPIQANETYGPKGELRFVQKERREGFTPRLCRESIEQYLVQFRGATIEQAHTEAAMMVAFAESRRAVKRSYTTLERRFERVKKKPKTGGMVIDG